MSLTDFRDYVPKRAVLGALMFMACMFSYVIRTNLSIIIVAMVNINTNKGSGRGPECSFENLNNSLDHTKQNGTMHNYGERFEWNQHIQGQLLSAYFYGTLPSSVPAGLLAEKFGGSRVVAFATLIPAILNLMMPTAAEIHYGLVLMLRFIMGFFGSAVYPALHAMIARWVPPSEKGIFVWTMQGGPFGTFVTLAFCGAIISNYGWKAAYYSTSSFMLIFYILWVYLAYDTPDLHPTITEEEKSYITEQIGSSVSKKKTKLPVRHVVTSGPFLVLLYAHVANMWGIYFISTNGPKYTLEVLGFNMKTGGAITGLPYIARLLAGILFAATGDYLRRKSFLSVGWIRKIFMIFSHMGPATCLLGVTFAGCNGFLAMAMMIAALAFNGAACQTNLQNHQDLAPNFAGSLYGIMNTLGSFPGFLIPPIVGILTNDHNGIIEWRVMFFLSAGVFISATILFWIFGSASVQPWNNLDSNKSENLDDQDNQINLTSKIPMSSDDEDENEEL